MEKPGLIFRLFLYQNPKKIVKNVMYSRICFFKLIPGH